MFGRSTDYNPDHMIDLGEKYELLISAHVISQAPAIPFYSTVHGEAISSSGALDSSYWRSNLERPVQFCSTVQSLIDAKQDHKVFLEIGPHSALAGPLRQIFQEAKILSNLAYVP